MRTVLSILVCVWCASGFSAETLFEARGFKTQKCYREMVLFNQRQGPKMVVFPLSRRPLVFAVQGQAPPGEHFFEVVFKMAGPHDAHVLHSKVLNGSEVFGAKTSLQGHPVPCAIRE